MAKRLFDLTVSVVAIVLLCPLFFLITLMIRASLGSPVLFRQTRPGIAGRPFEMVKFRTMRDIRDLSGNLLPDHDRVSSFGSFLRSTSLDELPELVNVLRGEMSLVGPRPLLMEYLPLYTAEQARRHEVKPGITGWAQVNGRNTLTWEEVFWHDVWYVDHHTLSLDVKILIRTLVKVLRREGISQDGYVTRDRFRGAVVEEPAR